MNASLDLVFDDFEEVENHEMAQPLLTTFDQLFEGMIGTPWQEFMGLALNTEGCQYEENS